ncbi:MAG: hypothetical protein OJF52_002137 [Nitrospira sp.]|jgi:hypothetical protein|nr:MAG: hypothetical protein OJF52_002137 [Nitrospira sp.]
MAADLKHELGGEKFRCLTALTMKGVIMRFRQFIVPTVTLLAMSVGLFGSAEAKTVEAGEATASWNGKGIIEDLGDGERIFRGSINGTMFIRHPDGAAHTRIHAAKIDCQAIVRLSGNEEERQSALCMMTAHEGKDIAYGEMRCVGKKDECKGEFTFSWGRGAFKGVTGTTPFVGGINIEQKEEGRIYGYAAWPHMTYSLP